MWQGIEGHDEIAARFRHAITSGRLASSFLFVGPDGIGKRLFARRLAASLLCETRPPETLDACGECPACKMVQADAHPDIVEIQRPEEKQGIILEQLIGDRAHRGQEGFCHSINLKPYSGRRKIGIIDDADTLNAECANALLKTLEEPPARSVLILIGTSPSAQLPTIRSRVQTIRFQELSPETVCRLLLDREIVDNETLALRLAGRSGGSIARAIELADPLLWEFRDVLLERLTDWPPDSCALIEQVSRFVDEAGKVSAARRARLRIVLQFAVDLFRRQLRTDSGAPIDDGDEALDRAVEIMPPHRSYPDDVARRLDRTLDAIGQSPFAYLPTLIDAWAADISL